MIWIILGIIVSVILTIRAIYVWNRWKVEPMIDPDINWKKLSDNQDI